jgi:hypothetical protein
LKNHRLFIDFSSTLGAVAIYDGFSVLIVISNATIAKGARRVHSRSKILSPEKWLSQSENPG